MGSIFDSLQLKKRLESVANEAGKSIATALTPKSPVPLSLGGLQGAAEGKAKQALASGEKKARGKAKDLENATVGKVGTAVQSKIDNTASAVEAKVDKGIETVGKKVDEGIGAVDAQLDKAGAKAKAFVSGKPKKAAPAPAPAPAEEAKADTAAAKAEPDDAAAAPVVIGRKRSNAVTAKPSEAAADTLPAGEEAKATEDDDDIIPSWFFADDSEEKFAAMETADPYADDDVRTDLKGAAADAADERKGEAGTASDTEITEEDASEFDEADDAGDPVAEAVGDEADKIDEKAGDDVDDEDADTLTEEADADSDELKGKKRELRKKLRVIENETRLATGGGLATGKASGSKDPWMAYFLAVGKFKKKIAIRDFKDDLAGKKKETPAEASVDEEEKLDEDATVEPTAEDEPGREDPDKTEVEIQGGLLFRSQKSPMQGGQADTTDPDLGSADGRQIYVADKNHKLYLAYRPIEGDDHLQLLNNDDIAVGGEIRVQAGSIEYLSNDRRGLNSEDEESLIALLRGLRDAGVPMTFDVYEASMKNETTAKDLLDEADKAEPEPEQVDLAGAMAKSDAWKTIVADFPAKVVNAVAEREKWTVVSDQIVDATGAAVDPTAARELLQKELSKTVAGEAAASLKTKVAAAAGA